MGRCIVAVGISCLMSLILSRRNHHWKLAVKARDILSTSPQNPTVRVASLNSVGEMQNNDTIFSLHHQKKRI
jgi:hypothetical protein